MYLLSSGCGIIIQFMRSSRQLASCIAIWYAGFLIAIFDNGCMAVALKHHLEELTIRRCFVSLVLAGMHCSEKLFSERPLIEEAQHNFLAHL